ncbi:hypothetical protein HG536_0E03050 [Torulaspora globosa]|uniref:2-dehydropantoate 2-reductase n=1 Tax=Torulaspora globosa TaxID=48254 RepID=A0A7G3ZIQ8_9SACH|nr:uncharacterized protein HG536_0E03050 [Torulaspora globosa]QLL33394.1 hypothetical protein HG536_0E03050 [Torulaspora globosa]
MTTSAKPVIHILGLGAMGALLAVDLLRFTNATVVPLFRSQERLHRFQNDFNSTLAVRKLFEKDQPLLSCKLECSESPETFAGEMIKNLIITTKTYQTAEALQPYLRFIGRDTNLILVQNGLGVAEMLKEKVFTDPETQPQLFQGVISHGGFHDQGFTFNHAGLGDLKIARLPWDHSKPIQSEEDASKDRRENELVKILTEPAFAENFQTTQMTYQEMLLGQLYKFLVNACINPVTSIVDCVNGELADDSADIFSLIIDECLRVLKVAYTPLFEYETRYHGREGYPPVPVLSVLNTENMVKEVIRLGCVVNRHNSSSMRQDTLYLRDTEIDYINGYIVKLADKYQLNAKVNRTIQSLVDLRLALNRKRKLEGDMRSK